MSMEHYKEVVANTEENFLEAMRGFLNRMGTYANDFHAHNKYDIASCLIDTILCEAETLKEHRDLYDVAKNMLKELDK